ncbi:glycoside hydrolase family 3 protein [Exilibacterium tricleocarpae]|uniref:Glycoside hydrolase family 3 protein n=1 Tax=Exilibacterium tricleocarpae TaxID=2591008 RepID=A0A545SY60_9GAMM|nr:glycoside hydrolase family 3 N-terminal domain-containing protein [Exilibacterium tricleocarpae]TQV69906.1 glycoside hydrolase family 3 protein [Exilibacterium tricleocarpae]
MSNRPTSLSYTLRGLALVALTLLAAGCEQPHLERSTTDSAVWPVLRPPLDPDPALEKRVDTLLAQMTLEQKVGQIIQAEIGFVTPEDVRRYHLGSVLNGGGTYANGNRYASVAEWVALADAFYLASMDTAGGGLAIPMLWGTDAVHGHNKIFGATLFPHNIGLGAAGDPALVRDIARVTARAVRATGLDWTFAPSLSVVRDDRWGRTYEGYAEDPQLVERLAGAAVAGFQGALDSPSFLDPTRVLATAKHYLGDGGTENGIDRGDTTVTEAVLRDIHAPGYFAALDAGVQTVMASHSSWQGERMHGHKYLLTDVLKQQLGFDGFVIGDWNSHGLVPGCSNASCPQAINAGVDMIMVIEDWREFWYNTLAQVKRGDISQARLDDAVRRILRVKFRAGLFDRGKPSTRVLANDAGIVGAAAHRALARRAVRQSLVLLKNKNGLLPLRPQARVLVAGDGADNIGKQAGGWSISWQGDDNRNADFPGATSIYTGIRAAVTAAGGSVEFNVDGAYRQRPDVAIVVYGENPYAEWQGDLQSPAYQPYSHRDARLLEKLQSDGIPVVSIFISGRPLWVNRALNASDAFVAAWLPGTEGAGIADVIFTDAGGEVQHDFTGRLSFSWPRLASQVRLNRGDADYEPLFPYGYGLGVNDEDRLADKLPITDDFPIARAAGSTLPLFSGRPAAPWMFGLSDGREQKNLTGASGGIDGGAIAEADKDTQGDARDFIWHGRGRTTISLHAGHERPDLSNFLASQAALQLDIRLDRAPSEAVFAAVRCGGQCGGDLDITAPLAALPAGQWRRLSIDLQCFAQRGADFSRVNAPFAISTAGALKLRVANIKLTPDAASAADIRCPG